MSQGVPKKSKFSANISSLNQFREMSYIWNWTLLTIFLKKTSCMVKHLSLASRLNDDRRRWFSIFFPRETGSILCFKTVCVYHTNWFPFPNFPPLLLKKIKQNWTWLLSLLHQKRGEGIIDLRKSTQQHSTRFPPTFDFQSALFSSIFFFGARG